MLRTGTSAMSRPVIRSIRLAQLSPGGCGRKAAVAGEAETMRQAEATGELHLAPASGKKLGYGWGCIAAGRQGLEDRAVRAAQSSAAEDAAPAHRGGCPRWRGDCP